MGSAEPTPLTGKRGAVAEICSWCAASWCPGRWCRVGEGAAALASALVAHAEQNAQALRKLVAGSSWGHELGSFPRDCGLDRDESGVIR
jgi:hypothetical protein